MALSPVLCQAEELQKLKAELLALQLKCNELEAVVANQAGTRRSFPFGS
jgi:hypothetical protein